MNINLSDELQKIARLWPTIPGLIASIILSIVLISLVSTPFNYLSANENYTIVLVILYAIVPAVIIVCWLFYRISPKNKHGKFGFVVSIYCDNYETNTKFRDDFINKLKKQITDGQSSDYFSFIELPSHISENINNKDDALKLLDKSGSHFIIYGKVKTRKNDHYLELNSIVTHNPIAPNVSSALSHEMSELLPRKLKIADDNFLEHFELASVQTEIASKYLIANARFLSGDIDAAYMLYDEVLAESSSLNNYGVFQKLKDRSNFNLSIIYDIRISVLYEAWVKSHENHLLTEIIEILNDFEKFKINNQNIETIKAIITVLLDKNASQAIKILSKFPKNAQNATWLLNMAFLHAYQGDLTLAYRHYSKASQRPISEFYDGLLNKVEDFILLMIEQQSDLSQLHYCLGIINKDFKGDLSLAKNDFEKFVASSPDNMFKPEKIFSGKWINNIDSKAA